jgi:hypothetical protein
VRDALPKLFRDLVDLSAAERARYFDANGIPQEIRDEVESLIRFDTQQRLPLTASVAGAAEHLLNTELALAVGGRCGPYMLVRELGRGGMAIVFLAQRTDGEVEQRVAIKFVPATRTSATFLPH